MAVIIDAEVAFERIFMRPVEKQYTHYGIVKYILYVTMYPTCPAKKVGKTAEASRFAKVKLSIKNIDNGTDQHSFHLPIEINRQKQEEAAPLFKWR